MSTKVKRSNVKTFLNTNTPASPTWVLIGDGVTTAKIQYNPKTIEETYITEDNAEISVDSYAPTFPVEMTAKTGDAAFDYLNTLRKGRSVLDSAQTEICNVWLYETPANGFYYAEKQTVSLQVDDFGGDGGTAAKLNYTINYIGNPTLGIFNAATPAFAANPVTTILTTLVLGSGTLAPLFATDKSNLLYTTSIAAATVTMASTLAGSTIVQKVGSTVVSQGAAAALSLGVNHLSIQVTVGSEVSTYYIDATRTV